MASEGFCDLLTALEGAALAIPFFVRGPFAGTWLPFFGLATAYGCSELGFLRSGFFVLRPTSLHGAFNQTKILASAPAVLLCTAVCP